MKLRRYISGITVVAMMLISTPALLAQESVSRHALQFSWGAAIPMGDKNFTNKTTYVAPQLGYEYRFASNFSASLSLGLSYSDEKGLTRDSFDGDVITANTHRKLTLVPVQAQMRYSPLGAKATAWQPYVGIGAGVQYAKFYIMGDVINTSGTSDWAEVITPHVGLRYQPSNKRVYFDLQTLWQYAGNSWKIANTQSQQNIGVRIGVGISIF